VSDWPPANYHPEIGTGYSVTFNDFLRLVRGQDTRKVVGGFLRDWFGYSISDDGVARVLDGSGAVVELETLHAQIQSDPKHQYDLYQAAMDFWR
jgi:hypothetical protein